MAISATFYNISADPRELTKDLGTAVITCDNNIVPYEPIDYIQPRIILDYNANVENCNYCYVSDWGRYYFIRDVELVNGQKMIVHLDEDVLMTYNAEIKELPCYVLRSETPTAVTHYIYDERSPHFIQGWSASFYPDGDLATDYVNLTPDYTDGLILITAG